MLNPSKIKGLSTFKCQKHDNISELNSGRKYFLFMERNAAEHVSGKTEIVLPGKPGIAALATME